MTDYANMLRQAAAEMRHYGHDGWPNACDWGADEIDRLTHELQHMIPDKAREAMLQSDNERLRGLLREAKQATRRLIEPGPNSFWWELSGRIDAALGAADRSSTVPVAPEAK